MSHKWRRNKAWEDKHLTGALTPVRVVLRALETIPLAIVLLTFISLYAVLASVPIGMLALIPTYLFYGVTVLVPIVLFALGVIVIGRRVIASRGARFVVTFLTVGAGSVVIAWVWSATAWGALKYSETTGEGVRFFAGFAKAYEGTTLRRLPGFEMTELQFYSWWPMKLALIVFVVNMVVTTVRRIEFNFKNTGVLSVHAGIVIIALGSLYYQQFKLEGDVLLPAASGDGSQGMPRRTFFSREEVVLYVAQEMVFANQPRFEQRLLRGLPRYNDYNLDAAVPQGGRALGELLGTVHDHDHGTDKGRTLSLDVPHPEDSALDRGLGIEVVGYAEYAFMETDLYEVPLDEPGVGPVRVVDLFARVPGLSVPEDSPAFRFALSPEVPARRVDSNQAIAVEYTLGMDEARWNDLSVEVPVADPVNPALHALLLEIPSTGERVVVQVGVGQRVEVGDSGWSVVVDQLEPEPPFPIITPGYEDSTSSVAILTVDPPGDDRPSFTRWVFHRFPELNQDLTPGEGGRPNRTAPDPALHVSYLDLTRLQVYIDETSEGTRRALVRQPATAEVRVFEPLTESGLDNIVPNDDGARIDLRMGASWDNARTVQRPVSAPPIERDGDLIGTHNEAFVAVRVTHEDAPGWSETVWVPFAQYMGIDEQHVTVGLPDGSPVMIGFGRAQRPFPNFSVSLVDFEMIAYDHRGAPRDYQSLVRVEPAPSRVDPNPGFRAYEHIVKLNAPLRAPYHWDPEASWVRNASMRLLAGMNPDQFKLSQSGWDRAGWNESQELVDQGVLEKPRVNFTILGVGNNPGIHIIALGSILISLGIPWAFYLKPYLVRRERDRLAAAHKQGTLRAEPTT